MHSFSEVIAALNDLRDRGIVDAYAVGEAMAATFWDEAIPTFDLDVLIRLPGGDSSIVSLEPIYRWATANGYTLQAEHIVGEVPVQFLPAYNSLAEEAVSKAKVLWIEYPSTSSFKHCKQGRHNSDENGRAHRSKTKFELS